jgi:hypothetical protein
MQTLAFLLLFWPPQVAFRLHVCEYDAGTGLFSNGCSTSHKSRVSVSSGEDRSKTKTAKTRFTKTKIKAAEARPRFLDGARVGRV